MVHELVRVAPDLMVVVRGVAPALTSVVALPQTGAARDVEVLRRFGVDQEPMHVFVHAGDVLPGLATVRAAQETTDLDAHVHRAGVARVDGDVLGVGDMRRPREAPGVDRRYIAQTGQLAPRLAEVVRDEEFRRLCATEDTRTPVNLDGFEAVDVVLSEAVVA